MVIASAAIMAVPGACSNLLFAFVVEHQSPLTAAESTVTVQLKINGVSKTLQVDPRVTLLDALRERLDLTRHKKRL